MWTPKLLNLLDALPDYLAAAGIAPYEAHETRAADPDAPSQRYRDKYEICCKEGTSLFNQAMAESKLCDQMWPIAAIEGGVNLQKLRASKVQHINKIRENIHNLSVCMPAEIPGTTASKGDIRTLSACQADLKDQVATLDLTLTQLHLIYRYRLPHQAFSDRPSWDALDPKPRTTRRQNVHLGQTSPLKPKEAGPGALGGGLDQDEIVIGRRLQ